MRVLLAPTLKLAQEVASAIDLSVEAEYGDSVIQGTLFTAAHHTGEWKQQPPPCCNKEIPLLTKDATILISHLDLDTLGGIRRAIGRVWNDPVFGESKQESDFWSLAGFVDLNGPHKISGWRVPEPRHPLLSDYAAWEEYSEDLGHRLVAAVEKLHAYWAWAESRPRLSRDIISDVTEEVLVSMDIIDKILAMDEELLSAGRVWKEKKGILNQASFMSIENGVVARKADSFVNHLYDSPEGEIGKIVVALNTKFSSITVSFADAPTGETAKDIVQSLWGLEAGGHAGIAGSPRGRVMTEEDLMLAVEAAKKALS